MKALKRYRIGWLSLLLVFCLGTTLASAHAALLRTTPSNGEVLKTAPHKIALEFSEPLEPDLIGLKLYGWNGEEIKIKGPKLTPGNASQMYAEVPGLSEGTYTVAWSVVSEDGHPVKGSYSFSIGKMTPGKIPAPGEHSYNGLTALLIVLRFLVEGIILLGGGLYWLAWYAAKRGFPAFTDILGKVRYYGWAILLIGSITEWFVYSATLPGESLLSSLFRGRWELIGQSSFAMMLLVQFVLLFLLVIPGMVEGWYLFVWTLLISAFALGGHVWGTEPVWAAIMLRVLHLLAISIWLGGLTYLVLLLKWEKRSGREINRAAFHSFFVRMALIAACGTAVTGAGMATVQTGWSLFVQNEGRTWGVLLLLKVVLFCMMLAFALKQTLHWAKDGHSLLRDKLKWEWLIGIVIILAGVWMSQISYPHAIDNTINNTIQILQGGTKK
jgi:copper transport protein